MSTSPETEFTALEPVKIDAVESELEAMWRTMNAQVAANSGHAVARNSVMTLVVIARSPEEANALRSRIHAVNTQHPSRAIVVSANPRADTSGINAFVGAYTTPDSSCYGEDIVIDATSDAVRHLPGVILPLIVTGLPSYLWWTGTPPWGTELLESIVDGSDRFFVDLGECDQSAAAVAALDDLVRRKAARCAIGEMGWTSHSAWREIIAQFFDSTDTMPYLSAIERVSVDFAAGDVDAPFNSSQAYLLAGWLGARLGWQVPHGATTGADFNQQHTVRDSQKSAVLVELNARHGVNQKTWWAEPAPSGDDGHATRSVRSGALMSVHITCKLNNKRATFTVAREKDLEHATTVCHVPDVAIPSQTVHLESIGERDPLAEQLRIVSHDAIFESALAVAAQLMGVSGRRMPQ